MTVKGIKIRVKCKIMSEKSLSPPVWQHHSFRSDQELSPSWFKGREQFLLWGKWELFLGYVYGFSCNELSTVSITPRWGVPVIATCSVTNLQSPCKLKPLIHPLVCSQAGRSVRDNLIALWREHISRVGLFLLGKEPPEKGRTGDWQLSVTGLAHISTPLLLPTSKHIHRARTGNLWRFHCLKKSAWVVCHIKSRYNTIRAWRLPHGWLFADISYLV